MPEWLGTQALTARPAACLRSAMEEDGDRCRKGSTWEKAAGWLCAKGHGKKGGWREQMLRGVGVGKEKACWWLLAS